MENRITRLIVPIAIALLVFVILQQFLLPDDSSKQGAPGQTSVRALDPGQAVQAEEGENGAFVEDFGDKPGDVGFALEFVNYGAGIKSARLLDQYHEPNLAPVERAIQSNCYQVLESQLTDAPFAEAFVPSFTIEDYLGVYPLRVERDKSLHRVGKVLWQRVKAAAPDPSSATREVTFALPLGNGLTLEKVYRFYKGSRRFQIVLRIRNTGGAEKDAGGWWHYRFRCASVVASRQSEWGVFNPARAFAKFGESVASAGPTGPSGTYPRIAGSVNDRFQFAGSGSRFYMCALYPDNDDTAKAVTEVQARSLPEAPDGVSETKPYGNVAAVLLVKQRVPATSEPPSELTFNVYLGPKDPKVFEDAANPAFAQLREAADLDLESGCCVPGGPTMAKLLRAFLNFLYSIVGNWGVAIILLTIIVKGLILPVNYRQQKAMRAYTDKISRFKPEMDRIREKHKDNPQRMNQELMKIQRENKLFPPLMGCLPMLLVMPVWIGLFMMLRTAFELRHQPFLLWMDDLSQPDRLFEIGGPDLRNAFGCSAFPLPDLHYLNLLPLLFTGFYVANSFLQTPATDPQQRQMQNMMRWMPILFMIMLYNYASGLALYMTVSAIWGFVEMRILKKKLGVATMTSM